MILRKPKQFDVEGFTVTVDTADWPRVRPLITRMRVTPPGAPSPVFLVNLGTADRPVFQSLASFILDTPGVYVVLKDRTDPGDHRKANLVRA